MRNKLERHGLVGPASLWEMKRAFQMDFLRRQGLATDDYLLDLGCGTLRGGAPIIAFLDPGHYYGLDVRAEVLDEARRELQDENLAHKSPQLILNGSLDDLDMTQNFDVIWSFQVFIHMTDAILSSALAFARRRLKPDGVLYATVRNGTAADGSWRDFPAVFRPLAFYRDMAAANGLDTELLGTLRALGHDVDPAATVDYRCMLRMRPSK